MVAMNSENSFRSRMIRAVRELAAIVCVAAIVPGNAVAVPTQQPAAAAEQAAAKLPAEQLDSLVAPIALYPDPLLSQTLVASTYPLEVVQLQQWLNQHKDLNEKALADAVKKQDWDPSIPGTGCAARCGQAAGGKHQVDDGPWECSSRAAERCDGRRAAYAQEGAGRRQPEVFRAAKGGNQDRRKQAGDRGGAGQPAGGLCTQLQPDRGLWRSSVCLSSHCLSAAGLLRGGYGHLVRRRRCHGRDVERRMGLQLRMGGQQQHQHQ